MFKSHKTTKRTSLGHISPQNQKEETLNDLYEKLYECHHHQDEWLKQLQKRLI